MKHFIFDFDGTLVDSRYLVWEYIEDRANDRKLTPEDLREYSATEVIPALGIKPWEVPQLMIQVRRAFLERLDQQPIIEGVVECFRELRKQGHCIHVVSSNAKENIDKFLQLHEIDDCVDRVISFFGLFGKAKILRNLMRDLQATPGDVMYIGDETRDIVAAQKAKISSLAVTWGYNSENVLAATDPSFLARNPSEMIGILSKRGEL
ncbi:MAG: HAD hydrolase-like protein [Oligoflexales bacterium]